MQKILPSYANYCKFLAIFFHYSHNESVALEATLNPLQKKLFLKYFTKLNNHNDLPENLHT